MTAVVIFRPFDRKDVATYAAWFADAETARRVTEPDAAWLDHVFDANGPARVLVATLADEAAMLAVLQYDLEADDGISLMIAIDPARRGQGLGKRVLTAFAERVGQHHAYIDGHVDEDNLASIRCLESCGFVRLGEEPDEGFLHYRKALRPAG